jgi:hypothetical protein
MRERGERGEHRFTAVAQTSPGFHNGCFDEGLGAPYGTCFGWSPLIDCPRYDLSNIGQYFGCVYPTKKRVR